MTNNKNGTIVQKPINLPQEGITDDGTNTLLRYQLYKIFDQKVNMVKGSVVQRRLM